MGYMKELMIQRLNYEKFELMKNGVPICPICGKPMKQAYDNIAKGFTGYLWKCRCMPEITMSVG